MKKIISATLVLAVLLFACNEKTADRMKGTSDEKKDTTQTQVNYPYKAEISSDMSMGKPEHAKLVLDMYKAWEESRFDDMKKMLTDSVNVVFSDGSEFHGTADSLMQFGKQMRANYSTVNSKMFAWIPVHLNNTNEDYVLVWANDYVTDKAGKTDSTAGHSYWQIQDNKIAAWGEFQRKLVPPPVKKP